MAKKNQYTMTVEVGDGAVHFISNPTADPHIQHVLRYGKDRTAELSAATVLSGFDYLLSVGINMTEATRRLRLMRKAYQAANTPPKP